MAARRPFALLLLVATALAGLEAGAHQGASGVVKQRMETMKAIAAATKTVADMLKGTAPLDPARVAAAADVIAGHAREIPTLFPEGSNPPPSEALPVIWQDWNGFEAIAANLARTSTAMAEDARNGGAVAAACAACHKDYRVKK